jgi:hypothetical protein
MRRLSIRPGGLNALQLVRLLAALSLVFVAVLASAPVRPYFAEWRSVQKDYNELAAASGASPTAIAVKQIWKPDLGVTDRCTTCHLGMAGTATPISGHALFGAHPAIPHDPREFGCTVCHGGQGRATTKESAHGFVSHWDEQILDKQNLVAGCGTCHDQFPTAPRQLLADGARRVEQFDCLSCHRVDGRGRGTGPELTYVGLKGFASDWFATHLAKHDAGETEDWRTSFGPIPQADLIVLDRFLHTRVGAPAVVDARAAMERGCLGCHKLNGVGGDEGPRSMRSAVSRRRAQLRQRAAAADVHQLHARAPDRSGACVPGSTMLAQDYTPQEVDLLTNWALFLRSRNVPPPSCRRIVSAARAWRGAPPSSRRRRLRRVLLRHAMGRGEGRSYGASERASRRSVRPTSSRWRLTTSSPAR